MSSEPIHPSRQQHQQQPQQSQMLQQQQQQHHASAAPRSRQQLTDRGGLLNTVVNAAASVNKALMENCSICTMYCDRQVKFEEFVQQQYDINTASMNLFHQANPDSTTSEGVNNGNGNNNDDNPMTPNDAQINQYKEFLFDETSVIDSVASRDAAED